MYHFRTLLKGSGSYFFVKIFSHLKSQRKQMARAYPVDLEWMVKKGKWLTLVVLEAVDTVLVMLD